MPKAVEFGLIGSIIAVAVIGATSAITHDKGFFCSGEFGTATREPKLNNTQLLTITDAKGKKLYEGYGVQDREQAEVTASRFCKTGTLLSSPITFESRGELYAAFSEPALRDYRCFSTTGSANATYDNDRSDYVLTSSRVIGSVRIKDGNEAQSSARALCMMQN